MTVPDVAFTHGGVFHADDIFSAALLQLCNPNIRILRGFNVPDGFSGIVFDVGGGEFDHHSSSSPARPNGIKYAAFGLLWRQLGTKFFAKEDADRFDEHFIQPLDLDDNTGCGNLLSSVISAYNSGWDEQLNQDACFARAQALAKDILWQKIKATKTILRAHDVVMTAYGEMQDGIVCLPAYAPWKSSLIPQKDVLFVVYPSQRGGYCAQGVPVSFATPALRAAFPKEWAGLENQALEETADIGGLTFCHAGCFLISAKTKAAAIEACKVALRTK